MSNNFNGSMVGNINYTDGDFIGIIGGVTVDNIQYTSRTSYSPYMPYLSVDELLEYIDKNIDSNDDCDVIINFVEKFCIESGKIYENTKINQIKNKINELKINQIIKE